MYEFSHGLDSKASQRKIFIATDEPKVIEDAKKG